MAMTEAAREIVEAEARTLRKLVSIFAAILLSVFMAASSWIMSEIVALRADVVALRSATQRVGEQQRDQEARVLREIEAMRHEAAAEKRISSLEQQAMATQLEKRIITLAADMGQRVSALESLTGIHQQQLRSAWPRLRALGENVAILAREIERYHKHQIVLKEPEAQ